MTDNKKLSTRTLIIAFAVIFAAACLCALWLSRPSDTGRVAKIYLDGDIIYETDLNAVDSPYEFTVECEGGYNTIAVEKGRICVSSADCSDNTCVKQGWLSGGYTPIVCLPHGLTIYIEAPEDTPDIDGLPFDATAG